MLPKSTIDEFFEVIYEGIALQKAQEMSLDLTKDIDNPILTECIQSSVKATFFGLVFNALEARKFLKIKKCHSSKILVKRICVKAHKSKLRSKNKRYKVLKRPSLFDRLNIKGV